MHDSACSVCVGASLRRALQVFLCQLMSFQADSRMALLCRTLQHVCNALFSHTLVRQSQPEDGLGVQTGWLGKVCLVYAQSSTFIRLKIAAPPAKKELLSIDHLLHSMREGT